MTYHLEVDMAFFSTILSDILAAMHFDFLLVSDILLGIYSDILSSKYSDILLAYPLRFLWHSIWYIFGDSFWLRSGGEHSDPELGVEVRQGTL